MQRHQNNLHGLVMSTEDNYGKGLSMRNSNVRVSRSNCSTTSLITVHVSPDFCSAIGNAKILRFSRYPCPIDAFCCPHAVIVLISVHPRDAMMRGRIEKKKKKKEP